MDARHRRIHPDTGLLRSFISNPQLTLGPQVPPSREAQGIRHFGENPIADYFEGGPAIRLSPVSGTGDGRNRRSHDPDFGIGGVSEGVGVT